MFQSDCGDTYLGGSFSTGYFVVDGDGSHISTVNYNGTSAQTIQAPNQGTCTSGNNSYRVLKSNNTTGATLAAAMNIFTLTIGDVTAGSIFSDGGFQVTGSAAGTLSVSAGSRLNIGSTTVATVTAFPTNFTAGNITLNATSTVAYQANAAQTISSAPTYGNVILNTGAASTTKTAGGALTINGNFSISANTTFSGGTSLTHNIKGNWSNNGTFTSSTSTINLNGTSLQNVAGSSATTFNNLTVNNSAGVSLSGSVSATVNGTFTLTSGILSTNANYLIVSGTATGAISGGSSSSYVNGNLRRGIATGANTYAYPIGTSTVYAPVSIAFTAVSATGSLNGSTTNGDNANIGTSTFNSNMTVNRNWDFTVQSGLGTYTYNATFNWVSGDQDPSFNFNNAYVGKYSGSWIYPTVGTRTTTSIQITGSSSFSGFQVGNGCPSITASVSGQQNVSCYAGNNGSFTITASGGTAPYTFSTNNGGSYVAGDTGTQKTFSGLTAGTYYPRVKDAIGCQSPSCP